MTEANGITLPTARLTIEYGLDADGEETVAERWENLTAPDHDVPMITKAGLLTMAQQTLTYYAINGEDY